MESLTLLPNPSVSFFVRCERKEQVDRLWEKLSLDGSVLMPLTTESVFGLRFGHGRYTRLEGRKHRCGPCGALVARRPLFVGISRRPW